MKPKFLEQLEAKLKVLAHVQSKYGLNKEVAAAAKAKLGAELAEALAGELGSQILEQVEQDIQRLERGELQPGDNVHWQHGGDARTDTVVKVDPSIVVVDYSPGTYQKNYPVNRPQVKSADLDDLRKLRADCLTAGVE